MYDENSDGISVHDGFPNPATDTSLQTLDLNKLLVHHGASTYMVRVAGNDWNDIGIFDGDIAIIDRALKARPNDLVMWCGADELVVSANHRVPLDTPIWGVITAVIHEYRSRGSFQGKLRPSSQPSSGRTIPGSVDVPQGSSSSPKTVLPQRSSSHNHTTYLGMSPKL